MDENQDLMAEMIAEAEAAYAKARRQKRTSAELLVEFAVAKALDRKTLRQLSDRTIRALVVTVPDASWAEPIARQIRSMIDATSESVVRTEPPKSKTKHDTETAVLMRRGTTVIGVSQDPDRLLPPLLMAAAQVRVSTPAPDAEMLAKAVRRSQRGRVPERIRQLDVGSLTFEEITSVLVPGGFASVAVERLESLLASRLKVGDRMERIPRLEDAVEYGEARRWALDLRQDLIDLRNGRITAQDTDRGAIFFGPPGTGKTLLGRMIGEALEIPTIVTSVTDWFTSGGGYLNEVIKAQRQAFEEARSKAPCVLLLDEINMVPNIDQLGGSRNKDYWAPVVLDFYQLLDGATAGRDGVIVIGTTNRIVDINPAILRPGRCERKIYVGPPDATGIENIMRHHLNGDLSDDRITDLAMLNAARQTTGAEVMEQVRAARRLSRRAGRALAIEDLRSRIVGDEKRSERDRRRAAVHEAGHAIAAREYDLATLNFVTIASRGDSGGSTSFEVDAGQFRTAQDFEAVVLALLAGRAAEHVILERPSQGAGGGTGSDLAKATRLLANMQTSFGLGESLVYLGDEENVESLLSLDPLLRTKVDKAIWSLYDRACRLISSKKDLVVALADALMEREFLDAEQIESIISGHAAGRKTVSVGARMVPG